MIHPVKRFVTLKHSKQNKRSVYKDNNKYLISKYFSRDNSELDTEEQRSGGTRQRLWNNNVQGRTKVDDKEL